MVNSLGRSEEETLIGVLSFDRFLVDGAVLGGFCRVRSADGFGVSSYNGRIGRKVLLLP